MRTTAIINLKGGVAKTTTVVNLAAILARDYRQRVLLVDADSQCNTTEFFGGDSDAGNLANVLRHEIDGGEFAGSNIQPTDTAGIDLLAGEDSLMDLDLTKVETGGVQVTVLRDMAARLERKNAYDWCLIDCPPAFNAASAAALVAADDVIIPIKLDAFSLRGMTNLLRQIVTMRKINPRLRVAGVLPTMWYPDDKIKDAERTLAASGLPLLPHIRYSRKVDSMTFAQEPLLLCHPRSAAGIDYRRLAARLMEGGNGNG